MFRIYSAYIVMTLSNRQHISTLCENISNNIHNPLDNLKTYIEDLQIACFGPQNTEQGMPFTQILSSEELIITLLKTNKFNCFLQSRPDICMSLVDGLLSHTKSPWEVIHTIVRGVDSNYKNKKEWLANIWHRKAENNLSSDMALLIIKEVPHLIELDLLEIYKNTTQEHEDLWKESSNRCFISWCCQSSEMFCLLTSILNQFLLSANSKDVILKVIHDLVMNIVAECEKRSINFVALYPLKYQNLAISLQFEPKFHPNKQLVIDNLKSLLTDKPNVALLFLSHFPEWQNILSESVGDGRV